MLNQDNAGVKKWIAQLVDPSLGAARMPSMVPVETCLYSDSKLVSIVIGTSGEFNYCFDPSGTGNLWASSRDIAAPVYGSNSHDNRYVLGTTDHSYNDRVVHSGPSGNSEAKRVVGACIKIRYIGRSDAAAGVIRTCTSISQQVAADIELNKSYVQDGMTSKVIYTPAVSINTWYPHDLSSFDFVHTASTSNEATCLHGIGYGFTPGTAIEIESILNFEYVPNVSQMQLLGGGRAYGPTVSTGMLGSVTKGIKASVSKLTENNTGSVISAIFNGIGGYLTGSSMLPLKAMIL